MAKKVTLILGGAASGKSKFAEKVCFDAKKSRIYWATSQILDSEMQSKVEKHILQRGAGWQTIEEPFDAEKPFKDLDTTHILLMDCATLWLTNHLLAENDITAETGRLTQAIEETGAEVVVVTNETGQGIVPENALARRFREAQGRLNITLAERADTVVQVIAGLPNVLKGSL